MSPLIPINELTRVAAAERADAARNRARVLEAAARLFDEQGVENVSMDAIAEAACVGKGTLYRRFGDRARLALDADHMAHSVLAALSADLYRHLRRDRGVEVERIKDGLRELVRALTAAPGPA